MQNNTKMNTTRAQNVIILLCCFCSSKQFLQYQKINHYPQMLDIALFFPSQYNSPYQHSVEVPHLQVQPLILRTSQTKPHCQEHQGQRRHPRKHEADRPQIKPGGGHTARLGPEKGKGKKKKAAEIISSRWWLTL